MSEQHSLEAELTNPFPAYRRVKKARREEVKLDFKSWLGTFVIVLIPFLAGGLPFYLTAQIPIVTCQTDGTGCWAEYRLFGLVPVSQVSIDEAWEELKLNSWGGQLLGVYLGGFFFLIGFGFLTALILPGRVQSTVLLTGLILYGLGLGYLALLVPSLSCRRLEPAQVDCQEEYRLAGLIKVSEGRLLKGVESATVDEDRVTRTKEIQDKDGRGTGRTRQVTYTGYSIQLSGNRFDLNWPVFDQTAGEYGWLNYFQRQRAQRMAERLNDFAGDPTQAGLTLYSVRWVWRIFMLGISLLLLYISGSILIREFYQHSDDDALVQNSLAGIPRLR